MIKKLCNIICAVNEKTGQVVGTVTIVIMIVTVYEIIARYVFNHPTVWAWDLNAMCLLFLGVVAGGCSVLHNVHVRIDVVYVHFPPKVKALADMITSSLFFLTFAILMLYGSKAFITSYIVHEVRMESSWNPILWPIMLTLPIGALLFLLQGVAEFMYDYSSFRSGKERERGVM